MISPSSSAALLGLSGAEAWRREVLNLPDYCTLAVKEDSRMASFLGWLQPWNRAGWATRAITLGFTIRIPADFVGTDYGARVVAHEAQHVVDAKRLTRVGLVLAYLLAFPVVLTARAWIEVRGFEAEARAMVRAYGGAGLYDAWAARVAGEFVGGGYLFMAPWGRKWAYKRIMAAVVDELQRRGEWSKYVALQGTILAITGSSPQ